MDFSAAIKARNGQSVPPAATGAAPAKVMAERSAPAIKDPFDMAMVRERLQPYDAEIALMAKRAGEIEIGNDDAAALATEMGAQVHKLGKRIEEARKKVVEPHNVFVKDVNTLAKGFTTRLDQIKAALGGKITAWTNKKAEEERKRQEQLAKEQAALQAKLDAEAKAAGVQPTQAAPVVSTPAMPKKVSTAEGTAYQTSRWTFEITDETQVPREFCMPDPRKIRAQVEAGIREIPGVRVFQETKTSFR